MTAKFSRGTIVIAILHSPREKCWGVLDEISTAGVSLRGLDLNSFEDWIRAVGQAEQFVDFSDLFFPLWRVERISRDETTGGIPSLAEQVKQRTGRSLDEIINEAAPARLQTEDVRNLTN